MKTFIQSKNFIKQEMPHHFFRNEIKFETDFHKAEEIRHNVAAFMDKDVYADKKDNSYIVNSLYFETPYSKDYIEKELGVKERQKIRLRTYSGTDIYKLEIKRKVGDVATKYSTTLDENQALQIVNGSYDCLLNKSTVDSIFTYFQMKTNVYRPFIIVSYKRYPYFFASEGFRITFDTNLRWTTDTSMIFKQGQPLSVITDKTIIEIKYDSFVPDWITKMMNSYGINASSNSKYVAACEKLYLTLL